MNPLGRVPELPARRAALLAALGARGDEVEELLRYNENLFVRDNVQNGLTLPLPDEPFVACWERWEEEARTVGTVAVLRRYLPQFAFPIRAGISQEDAYRAATLRGTPTAGLAEATGLEFAMPEAVTLEVYSSFAGRIPVLISYRRAEFVTLVQALAKRNEPVPIPEAQGAAMVAGLNNWQRIAALKAAWETQDPGSRQAATWEQAFAQIRQQPELYQDRLILLSDGPYSAVPAAALGLSQEHWRELSLLIRREHECTHYFTRRLFGSMRNHLLDELIADYTGLVAAIGEFRADWFLRFIGLEDFPHYRAGARLEIYRGKPPLQDGAFTVLQALIRAAALNLEAFDRATFGTGPRSLTVRGQMVTALATLRLEDLAADDAPQLLAAALEDARKLLAAAF